MKIRALALGLLFGVAALCDTPAHAQTVDPCTVYTCMAGISGFGASGGPACAPAIAYWHSALAVYSPAFNPPASAAVRKAYMASCEGGDTASNAAVFAAIMSTWGSEP